MKPLSSGSPLPKKLAKLREVADSRYRQWQHEHTEKQNEIDDYSLSPLGRALRRLERCTDRLKRGVKERCATQRAVSREYNCPEMLSSAELDWLEENMMTEVSHAVRALQQSNANDFFVAGGVSPASAKQAQERVEHQLPTQIRSVVNAELRVLRAEGAAQQGDEIPAHDLSISHQKRRHGPDANMSRHEEIGKILKPHASAWTTEENLFRICEDLDARKIAPPGVWKRLKPPARSWRRGCDSYPDRVRKVLQYSLDMLRHPNATPNRHR